MSRSAKAVLVAFAAGLLSVLACISLRHAWSDLVAFQARATIRAGEIGQPTNSSDWSNAQSRLERALDLHRGNPGFTEDLALLHEMRSRAVEGAESKAELGQALKHLRDSLSVRPTSPYTWGNIAFVKSRLGIIDDELFRAIRNAARLGPWEPEVQLMLADIGFRIWDRLPAEARDSIHGAVRRGLKRQDAKLFDLAVRYGRMDILCSTPGVSRSRRAIRCI